MNRDRLAERYERIWRYNLYEDWQSVNLDELDLNNTTTVQELRHKIENKFDAVRARLLFRMDRGKAREFEYRNTGDGYTLKVVYGDIKQKSLTPQQGPPKDNKDWVTFIFDYKGNNYLFGPRDRFYGDYHMSLGSATEAKKFDLTQEQAELMLILARIFGEQYEGFQNRVADSEDHYHVQFLRQVTTIWDAKDLKKFPTAGKLLPDSNYERLADSVMQKWKTRPAGTEIDLLFRSDGVDMEKIILVPRERIESKQQPKVSTLLDETFVPEKDHMGDFGALEMGGYLRLRSSRAFEFLKNNPDKYVRAIREITYQTTNW